MIEDIINLFNSFFIKKFKIAIVSYYYPFQKPSTSGVGIHVYNLVTNLSKLGCEVHVFTFTDGSDKVQKVSVGDGKIVLHFLSAKFPYELDDKVIEKRIKYSIFQNKVMDELGLEHHRRKFDVIHSHGWLTASAFNLKYLYKIPWIHTVHSLERNRLSSMTDEEKRLFRITSWIEDTLIDADKLIAVSTDTSKQIIRAFGNKIIKKIEIIPNGVDLKLFSNSEKKEDSILCVTRFSKEKGVDLLPAVINRILSFSNTKFVLVAQRTNIPTLLKITKQLDSLKSRYKERFIWVDKPMMPLELSKYYKKSSIYLQPSFYETFGLCILEAMACGNAVIATNVGGIPEVVKDSGILVKPDSKDISDSVFTLLKNKKLQNLYRKKAIQRSKEFDWKVIGTKTLELYKKVIERKKEIEREKIKK